MAKRRSWVETAKAVYPGETELADAQHRADQAEARVAELAAVLRRWRMWRIGGAPSGAGVQVDECEAELMLLLDRTPAAARKGGEEEE